MAKTGPSPSSPLTPRSFPPHRLRLQRRRRCLPLDGLSRTPGRVCSSSSDSHVRFQGARNLGRRPVRAMGSCLHRKQHSPPSCTSLTLSFQERIKTNKAIVLDTWLKSYEQAHADVAKLKQQYQAKTRRADDAEDEYVSPRTCVAIPNSPSLQC